MEDNVKIGHPWTDRQIANLCRASHTYAASVVGIGAKTKKGACSQTAPPVAFHQVVNASGPVKLP